MTPAQLKIREWRRDPVLFARDNFQFEPDPWQKGALESFGRQDQAKLRLSLQACVGPGKSAVLAICGWNFLSCYGEIGNHPKGAAVSITSDNLKDNLWPEFSKWQSRSPFLKAAFTWTKERIFANDHPETWFLSARSWSKTADPEEQGRTLSGLHSGYVLVLIDESGEIPLSVLKSGEQTMSEKDCEFGRIIQAGNPTSLQGMLYAAATTLRDQWEVIRITGDPDDANRSSRIDIEWARKQIETYGRDNPWVMATILGQFPPASINSLLGVEEVEAAMNRTATEDKYSFSQKRLGIDAARFGDDPWVIFPRQGIAAFTPIEMRNPRTFEVAARIAVKKAEFGSEMELYDDTGGYAAGAIDAAIQGGYSPVPVPFSGKASNPRFFNRRSEIWFNMAEWVKRGGILPKIPGLVAELTTPTYTYQGGKFRLEEKDQIKKRLGRSPNYADALALTFAMPDQPAMNGLESILERAEGIGKLKHEYDPLAAA